MLSNKYDTQTDLIATKISGGRPHHSYRQPVKASQTYEYEVEYGQNFHTLSAVIFGDDRYYWMLSDMNKPVDPFRMETGYKILLPLNIVRADENKRIL